MTNEADRHEPVFVVGNLKSGTSLVQALLDGHPELFVLPVELQFFKFPALPSLPPGNMPPAPAPEWKTPLPRPPVSPSELKREIAGNAEFEELLRTGRIRRNIDLTDTRLDRDRLRELLEAAEPESLRELYLTFFRAFHAATGDERPAEEVRWVEKCPHMEEYAVELKRWFPGARFLHVLRNPYANLYSLQEGARLKGDMRDRFLRPMAKSFYFLERNRRHLDDYRVVRYEDVVLETRRTMADVADFLGVEFHEELVAPTILGRPWSGNPRSVDDEFEGVDPRPVDAFRERIPALSVALVNRFFSPFLEEHGYERLRAGRWAPWIPLRWETPWHYLSNRRLLGARLL